MGLARDLIDGLREFNRKLRNHEPMTVTRVMTCTECENKPGLRETCRRCGGRGFEHRRLRMK